MGWKTWTRERLTVADMQMVTDQGVLSFASVSARDATIATSARQSGMVAFTEADGTYWGVAVDGGAWRPLGQINGGASVTVNIGWTGTAPKVFRSGPNQCRLIGSHGNSGGFTANATQYPITVPAGYRPAGDQVLTVPYNSPGNGAGFMLATLLTDGRLRYDVQMVGSPSPNASTGFFLDGVSYNTL